LDDFGTHRYGRHDLHPLQWLGRIGQNRKPAVYMTLPIFGCPSDVTRCEAAQIEPGSFSSGR
jgi:hypothetical protein